MKRISLEQIIKAVDGTLINAECFELKKINKVVTDSRNISIGDVYLPIIGERFDGHDFISQAMASGAQMVFSSRLDKVPLSCPAILVKDTKVALGQLAAYYRKQFDIHIVGVTGSVGKTSTKEMLASILSTTYNVHKTDGNFNNDIGLPLTVLGLEQHHEIAVIELGMNHFGEIDYLANILKPTIGMITNIGVSHIEFLGSKEGILKAKMEMLPHVSTEGLIILNGDDPMLKKIASSMDRRVKTYGHSGDDHCNVVSYQVLDDGGQKMTVATNQSIYNIEVAYPGEHMLMNALGGIIIAQHLGMSKEAVIQGIKSYKPAKMRLNEHRINSKIRIIDDAYNASVDSMASALKTLSTLKKKDERSVAVLGSMFEMGDYALDGHEEVGKMVAESLPDILITVGKEARWIYESAIASGYPKKCAYHFLLQEDLLKEVDRILQIKDVILLKASRGMAFEVTRDYLIRKFEE